MGKKEEETGKQRDSANASALEVNNLTQEQKIQLVSELIASLKQEEIPASIFSRKLGCLEATVKYLREEKKLRFVKIARMLNRSDKTIWAAYHQARKKMRERLTVQAGYSIPIKPIADRKQAVLQAVITHLKEHYEMEYAQIAKLLHRKYSTIAGTYRRHR